MIFHLFIIKPASGTYIFRYVWWFFSLYTLLCYLQWLHYFSTMNEMYTLRETPHEGWSYAKMLKYANDLDVVVTFFHLTWHRWATCCHFYFTKVTWLDAVMGWSMKIDDRMRMKMKADRWNGRLLCREIIRVMLFDRFCLIVGFHLVLRNFRLSWAQLPSSRPRVSWPWAWRRPWA